MSDNLDLQRFLSAQETRYSDARTELRNGKKLTHWIWFIFPQLDGLGTSENAVFYAIKTEAEAVAYLAHPILGHRLRECADILLTHLDRSINTVMGFPDDLKLQSSMTLFALISDQGSVFHRVLEAFYQGMMDSKTVELFHGLRLSSEKSPDPY